MRRNAEEEAPGEWEKKEPTPTFWMPINLEGKALGINFAFITHIVIQATMLPSDILNESATGYARKMIDYKVEWGKTLCKKEYRDQVEGSKELPKMQVDRAVSI